jgi:hypothetical protein
LLYDVFASLSTALESTSTETTFASETHEIAPSSLDVIERANMSSAEFEDTGDIQHSDHAIRILESLIENTPDNDPNCHHLLFTLALTLRRRVEIQISGKSIEALLDLHRALARCLFLLRQAVDVSPAAFDVKIRYLGQLGHTSTLLSTIIFMHWPDEDLLALLAQLKAERDATKTTQFFPAIVMASTLSAIFRITKKPVYLKEGREVYRHLLKYGHFHRPPPLID